MPLTFDLSLEQLKTYQGTNPRPDDFDEYWDRALAEMHAIDPDIELRPAGFTAPFAECFNMYFTGVGGARIHAQLLRPVVAQAPHPAVVQFHGYSGSGGDWVAKLPYVAMGFTVAALDCRGQGGLSEDVGSVKGNTLHGHIIRGLDDGPDKLLFRQIFLDTAQLAGIVMAMDDVDAARVGAMGASQGGGLTLACAALEPRIARAAPVYPFLSDYKRIWKIDQDTGAYAELKEYFRHFDPLHEREDDFWTRLGYVDVQFLAPRIAGQIMLAVGLRDTICPPSTQFAAYNKISSPKSLVFYPDFGHEGLPGHSDTIFQFLAGM